jgi:hypothetical protein
VAVLAPEAVRLPLAIVVDADLVRLAHVGTGTPVEVGEGSVTLFAGRRDAVRVRPGRWWDPRPALRAVEPPAVAASLALAEVLLPPWPPDAGPVGARLRAAPHLARDPALARGLVGLGPGSTPAGDDVLAGMLAALRVIGDALGAPGAAGLADSLWREIRPALPGTTVLSAALLASAARGETCAPATSVCRALAGREALRGALERLLAVGHTSGHALAAGLLWGARTALSYADPGAREPR